MEYRSRNQWAMVLGGSSGIGLASVRQLANLGFNVIAVHRDRRSQLTALENTFASIRATGTKLITCNLDALSLEGQEKVFNLLENDVGKGRIRTLLHSIALGNLKPVVQTPDLIHLDSTSTLNRDDFAQTIYNMGSSLLFWVQELHKRKLFASDARVFGLTSSGNTKALPGYAAVSAAKGVLEAVARTIAVEFAPYGLRCNILQPGTTNTPALRLIPGANNLAEHAKRINPYSRLTTPEDVAKIVALLSRDEADWINGSLIHVDGGEHLTL